MATGAGLGFVNKRGRLQDAFRARVLFPICDPSGHPVALGGRILPGSTDPAKYKNSTETPIYSKRRTLYALNWAKQDIIASGEVVVCEGYTDVIGFFEAGVPRAVATCGTALAEEHVRLLKNFATRVVLAFDADGAGQSAAGRFYEWERKLEIDVAVAALPPGSDPADLARSDPAALRAAVEGAKPFLQFRLERILDAADLSTRRGPGPGRRPRAGRGGRAPRRPGPGPVRDAGGRALPARARAPCATASSGSAGRDPAPRRAGPTGPRPGRVPRRRPRPPRLRRARRTGPEPEWDDWEDGPVDSGRRRSTTPEFRPGLEALRLAIHRPEDVGDRLEAVLFCDPVQRAAFARPGRGRRPRRGHRPGPGPGAVPAGPAHGRGAPIGARRGGGPAGPRHRPAGGGPVSPWRPGPPTRAMEDAAEVAAMAPGPGRSGSLSRSVPSVGSVAGREGTTERFRAGRMTVKKVVALYPAARSGADRRHALRRPVRRTARPRRTDRTRHPGRRRRARRMPSSRRSCAKGGPSRWADPGRRGDRAASRSSSAPT